MNYQAKSNQFPKPTKYLHLTEQGHLELCQSSDLCANRLNGLLLYPSILSEEPGFIERTISSLIHTQQASYLIISADPFCLPEQYSRLFALVPIPKGLILCDTHHGKSPLLRSLRFCIAANIQSVLIRFNQRHIDLFRLNGIWAESTVLSPDLHQIALEKILRLERLNRQTEFFNHREQKSIFRKTQDSLSKPGLFVGNIASIHPFRSRQFSLLRAGGILFDIKTTPNAKSMIDTLSSYSWGLNLPLNGDFNRRFIEILLADIPVLSEHIPASQRHFPFSRLLRHVTFFGYTDGLNSIKVYGSNRSEVADKAGGSPLYDLLCLVKSGYDNSVLSSYDRSLRQDMTHNINSIDSRLANQLQLYDECLSQNINPCSMSISEARQLISKARSLEMMLNTTVEDEFNRLGSYALAGA